MKSRRAFTVIEVLFAATILALIVGTVYSMMIHAFNSNERGVKNIDAIQEMSFIIHNIRSDLRTLIEFANDPESYITFNPADQSLRFFIVNGVNANGIIIYSQVAYGFSDNCLTKRYYSLASEDKLGDLESKKLAQKGKITGFSIVVCGASGNPVSADPVKRAADPPRYLKAKITHASNARLEINVSFYSTYMKSAASADLFWIPSYKVVPVSSQFTATTAYNDVSINLGSSPNVSLTANGVRVGKNMGVTCALSNMPKGESEK